MRNVARLPIDTGVSGWGAIAPDPAPAVELHSETHADFAIVGAGFAGLSAARRLSELQPKARIVLLEAKRVGEGPAGRNSGFMIDLPHDLSSSDYSTTPENDLKQIKLNRQAIDFASAMAADYGFTSEVFDRCGKVNGAAHERAISHNQNFAHHLEALGEDFELLSAGEMRCLTGSSFYKSGLYTPGTAVIQPVGYVRGIAQGLANSVSVFENSPVTAFHFENRNWQLQTPHGSVTAPKVILATNGHIESFGHYRRKLVHVMLYGSMTRVLSEKEAEHTGEANWGITPSDPSGTTFRKISGSGGARIITRNSVSYTPEMQIPASKLASVQKAHEASFAKRYPELENIEQEYTWAGRLCLSRNGVSAFGEIEPGLYSACCQNGLGVARGTLSGMAIAELACGEASERVNSFLEEEALQGLPPSPFDKLGANAFMRWGEFKARKEL